MASVDIRDKRFRYETDLKQLYDDIVRTAHIAEVPCNEEITKKVLDTYHDFFAGSSVAFRTTTHEVEKRELHVRYIELGVPHDPYLMALSKGLLQKQHHPIYALLGEFQSRFPVLGYGVDFDVNYGLEKIWLFFPHTPRSVEEITSLPSVPNSIENYAEYFAAYDLSGINVFGLDYRHKSVNVYFPMRNHGGFPPQRVASMIRKVGFQVPTEEMLHYCSMADPVYYTFGWDSSDVKRACFAVVTSDHALVPTHLDPLIERFVAQVPFAGNGRTFIFNITFGPAGNYIKIENDYTECKW